MAVSDERDASVAKLHEMIKGIRIAMLTTVARDGALHSRPMATQETGFDGTLWFFTGQDSAKAEEVAEHRAVNVSYANPEDHRYVSMSGTATIVRDTGKAEQLWSPAYQSWFPQGLSDPRVVLLRVDVEQAEYWDAASGHMVALAGLTRGITTQRATANEHEKVTLDTSGN